MKKNLILSAAIGYNFEQIEFFIKSLRRYFFEDICFVIGKKDFELEDGLSKYNCKIIKTSISKKNIQFERYKIFSNYVHNTQYNNILLCDARDIYFQQDPFKYDYRGSINFFLEDYKIKRCPYNSNWIIKTYGKSEFDKILNKTILCSGTVLGKYEKIQEYLNLMKYHISKFKYKKRMKYFLTLRTDPEGRGCDQGHANYIVHKEIIKNVTFHSNSKGPVATAFYLNKINFDKDSQLINELGQPYLLVHQYDKRYDEFEKHVNIIKKKL
ncbi:hypothetical protein OAN82_00220 [Pelagibacteraceae bacterium]|jgi:hypothetical protein|nr:hypothetical protein [Pelagibacteraceae bacterium]MDC1158074.1 hypothetical protein [Pelagibacteraceae bacterium]